MKTTSYAYQEEDISEVTVKLEADELPIRGDEEAGREEEAPHAVMSEEVRTVASLPTSSAPPQNIPMTVSTPSSLPG
ncbi:hypothetical protein SKAU_G00377850 [Synaphobranchus kaupii]|uniref:Uncharacterized protein n=1 Tax=Synaphobranchus kaupii TaxID=118154 RepID=A0A9Q1ED31_SYNKA|nr:hypothetical protein SKAU_G00377850 [Synaphobranchus kaupii]